MSGAKPATQNGQKSKMPKSGKGSAVLIRVTNETRMALDAEVERTGRSLSQTAEIWLDEARKGRATVEQLLGAHDLVPSAKRLGDIARAIDETGFPHEYRRLALIEGWKFALEFVLPWTPSVDLANVDLETARLKAACSTVLAAIENAGEADPVYYAAKQPSIVGEVINALLPKMVSPAEAIARGAQFGTLAGLPEAFNTLLTSGKTARVEIRAAASAYKKLVEALSGSVRRAGEARARGLQIARECLGIPVQPETPT